MNGSRGSKELDQYSDDHSIDSQLPRYLTMGRLVVRYRIGVIMGGGRGGCTLKVVGWLAQALAVDLIGSHCAPAHGAPSGDKRRLLFRFVSVSGPTVAMPKSCFEAATLA